MDLFWTLQHTERQPQSSWIYIYEVLGMLTHSLVSANYAKDEIKEYQQHPRNKPLISQYGDCEA